MSDSAPQPTMPVLVNATPAGPSTTPVNGAVPGTISLDEFCQRRSAQYGVELIGAFYAVELAAGRGGEQFADADFLAALTAFANRPV